MKMIGDSAIPLMLISLGVRMNDVHWRDFGTSLLAAAVCPLTGLVMAGLAVMFIPMTREQIGLTYLFGALPPAVLNFLFAERYKQEPQRVASIVLIGNLAALIFLPLALAWVL